MPLMYKAWMRTRMQISEKAKIEGKPVNEVKLDWQKVHGPAGAVTMSLHRAGWTWLQWHTWRTRDGFVVDARETCTRDIVKLFQRDVERQLWADWCTKHDQPQLTPAPSSTPC